MKCQFVTVLLAACVAAAAAEVAAPGPLDFLFEKCPEPDQNGNIGDCVQELLAAALERDREAFTTGIQLGNRTVVLEPVTLPEARDRNHDKPKWSVSEGSLAGLQGVQLESVMLTERKAALVLSFPQLTAEARMTVRYGFFPLRTRTEVVLVEPRLMVGATWGSAGGRLLLTEPEARLWIDSFNVTITGVSSIGKSVAQSLNDNSADIIEFMRPSLEAAVERALTRLDQDKLDGLLKWLQGVVTRA